MTTDHRNEPIAIIGMSCRFPGAPDPDALWELVSRRQESVVDYPAGRTPELDAFYLRAGMPDGPASTRGGFLSDIGLFDAAFFEISPREAEWLDPQQRLLLETGWEALEDAGIPLHALERAGVFVGVWSNDYDRHATEHAPLVDFFNVTGNALFGDSSRVSFQFNMRGPDVSVNAACSSSFAAVHLAVRSLRSGECSVALAGGANLIVRPETTQALSRAGVLSPEGKCRFGDIGADGYVRSDGAGMLVLKRLSDALRDKDRVLALVRGSAVTNSGKSSGSLARPSADGQKRAMREALADAELDAATIDFVEAHGTGTRTGDVLELEAMIEVFGHATGRKSPCRTASIKSNIGHAESAAGISAIVRTVQAMRHRRFPATLHVKELNPKIDWAAGVILEREGCDWPAAEGRPRRAGANGLGLTGTNAHVILEEAPPCARQETSGAAVSLLPVSASSLPALRRRAGDFARALEKLGTEDDSFADFVYTAAQRRTHLTHRLAVVGSNAGDVGRQLAAFAAGEETGPFAVGAVDPSRKVAFVFPGQGSQWVGMGRELLRTCEAFRQAIEEIDPLIVEETGWSVLRQLEDPALEERLSRIDVIQPTLFAIEIALAAWWKSCGVVPQAVVGHSMGEVAAACVAGILTPHDAVRVICRRSALLLRLAGKGAMAVVELTREEAEEAIAGEAGKISVAVCNSQRSTVLAGDPEALDIIVNDLEQREVFCRWVRVDVASHSPQMDVLRDDLLLQLAELKPQSGAVPLYSTVRPFLSDGSQMEAQYWADNLRCPVLFADAVGELVRQGFNTFVEMSPHPILVPFVEQIASQTDATVVAVGSLRREEPEMAAALSSLGRLYCAGAEIDWSGLCPSGNVVSLPAYPWQRERFWMEGAARSRTPAGHPLLGNLVETAAGERIWSGRLSVETHPWLRDHRLEGTILVPASAWIEMAIAAGNAVFGSAAVVEQLTLTEALALPSGAAVEIQAIAVPETTDSLTLQFFGRETGSAWRQTGECRIRNDSKEADSSADVSLWQDAELSERVITGDRHSRHMAELGYEFGQAFCCLDWMWFGDDLALGQIRNEARRQGYRFHPAVVDGALQVLAHLLLEYRGDRQMVLPVRFERLELHSSKLPKAGTPLLVKATVDPTGLRGDVTLLDPSGPPLLTIRGAELQALERETKPEEALYSLEWRPLPEQAANLALPWILIGGADETARELARALERKGVRAARCTPAAILSGNVSAAQSGAVWLDPLTMSFHLPLSDSEKILAEGAAVIAALAEQSGSRIWLATRGTQAAAGSAVENVLAAGAWGLAAALAHEYPSIPIGCIDLPAESRETEMDSLAGALLQSGEETRVAIRGGNLCGARLMPWDGTAQERLRSGELRSDEGFEVRQSVPGSLSSLGLHTVAADPPSEEEVEIAVEAAGLNFLDVLRAMNASNALSSAHFGGECAGIVVRVGSGVRSFRPGDSVLAISPSFQTTGMLASRVRVPEALVARKPDGMSFAEAAGIPCVFLTAWHGLVKLAHLQRGEKVLIHAAAGGVGLAAVQIAQWTGAEVWATAGSEKKRAWLRQLGVRHVMDSRTLDFSRQVLEQTGGRGVDVVLNSLAGAAVSAGLDTLAPYGRFVEIGKRDIWENSRLGMRPFLRNLSFFAVDLADAVEARRAMVGQHLQEVMERFAAGDFSPEPATVFPVAAAGEAFQHLASAMHIGKVILEMSDPRAEVSRSADRLHADARYLITGGLGGVGLEIAETLVRSGARHLVLTSRNAPGAVTLKRIATLERQGAAVEVRLADVSDPNAVTDLLAAISAGPVPLRGIVHAAGVLDDAVAANLSEEKFHRVMAAKVAGALAIDAAVRPGQLDFLVYASSAAGVLGSAGQGNYAAANAILDALAHRQRARNIPAVSIDWGTWSEVGLAAAEENRGARLRTHGLTPLPPAFAQALLMKILAGLPVQVAAMILDADRWCADSPATARSGFLDALRHTSPQGPLAQEEALAEFTQVQGEALRNRLTAWLRRQVAAVLRLDVERVPEDKAVRSLGLDSLMALELRNRLERQLHMKLSATLVWNYPTIARLAEFLRSRLDQSRLEGQANERYPQPEETSMAAPVAVATEEKLSAAERLQAELLEAELLLNTSVEAP